MNYEVSSFFYSLDNFGYLKNKKIEKRIPFLWTEVPEGIKELQIQFHIHENKRLVVDAYTDPGHIGFRLKDIRWNKRFNKIRGDGR